MYLRMLRWSTSDDLLRVGYGSKNESVHNNRCGRIFYVGIPAEAGLFMFRIGAICPFRTGLFDLFQTGLFSPFQPPPSVSALRSPVCEVAGFIPPFGLRRLRNSILLQFAELEESCPPPWFEEIAEFYPSSVCGDCGIYGPSRFAETTEFPPPPWGYLKKLEEISV